MATELTISQAIAKQKTPSGFDALSQPQQKEHRLKIGLRTKTVLGQFWTDHDTPEAEQILEIEGWQDVLEVLSEVEFRKAWAEYQRTGPRTKAGKLYKPDAGALYLIAMDARPKVTIVADPKPEEPPRERMTAEQRQQISDEVNFGGNVKVKSFDAKPEERE